MNQLSQKLEDCHVAQMDPDLFASDEKVYVFVLKDYENCIPLTKLPFGSLIFLNKTIPQKSGFNLAVCGIWKGTEEVTEIRKIVMRKTNIKRR